MHTIPCTTFLSENKLREGSSTSDVGIRNPRRVDGQLSLHYVCYGVESASNPNTQDFTWNKKDTKKKAFITFLTLTGATICSKLSL